jgi:hypothetical protein
MDYFKLVRTRSTYTPVKRIPIRVQIVYFADELLTINHSLDNQRTLCNFVVTELS